MPESNAWNNVKVGTLTDDDIHGLTKAGELITSNFEPKNVKQACYELRSSNVLWETSATRENKRLEISANAGYILKPHCYVTIIIQEEVALPNDVVARILTKGQLFSIGILPVNTYADPGFSGQLGITFYNASHRHIILKAGQPVAKIEFTRLPKSVSKPYSGQHGYKTEFWPIPVHMYATPDELAAQHINPFSPIDIGQSYGPIVASLYKKVSYYERRVWLQIAITLCLFSILLSLYNHLSWFVSVLTGVAANLITHVGINMLGPTLEERWRIWRNRRSNKS